MDNPTRSATSPAAYEDSSALIDVPVLDTIVVSYRCRDFLERCLQALRRHPPSKPMRVHVVDNNSGDGTVEMVRSDFPEVRVHALGSNAGFSRANNLVLQGTAAKYVLLLNPDAEVREGVLDHMLAVMEENPRVGMSGCRLEQEDGRFDHAAKRSFPTPVGALAHFSGLGRRTFVGGRLAQYRSPEVGEFDTGEVDSVNGAFMLVRREALEDVGLLDEGYWLYMEDLDWCKRFHQQSWKVLYDGRVTALHAKGGAAGKHRRLRQNIAFHQGMARFYRKFESGSRPLVDLAVYVGIAVKLAGSVTRSGLARAVRPPGRLHA